MKACQEQLGVRVGRNAVVAGIGAWPENPYARVARRHQDECVTHGHGASARGDRVGAEWPGGFDRRHPIVGRPSGFDVVERGKSPESSRHRKMIRPVHGYRDRPSSHVVKADIHGLPVGCAPRFDVGICATWRFLFRLRCERLREYSHSWLPSAVQAGAGPGAGGVFELGAHIPWAARGMRQQPLSLRAR